jgi:hypothetical protein
LESFTLEFIPKGDRVSPPADAIFSPVMPARTPAGEAYTFAGFREIIENAGFPKTKIYRLRRCRRVRSFR